MRSRVLVIPSVRDVGSFAELVSNLGHYFGHVDCERIVVPIESSSTDEFQAWLESPTVPTAFDSSMRDRVASIKDRLQLKLWPSSLEPPAITSDLVLDWDVGRTVKEPWKSIRKSHRINRTLFDVDWRGTRLGASWFAEAAMILSGGRGYHREDADRLDDLVDRLGTSDRAFLIGTGPSARQALDHDLSGGLRVACNTVVLDQELMDHVQPHLLVFADPIFHFGPSTYAQRFQHVVLKQAQRHDFTVVTTERFASLLRARVPDLAGRVIGVRQGTSRWPDNFDLSRHAAVRPYPNILTMLMLPLAATVARSIELIGFDGRTPDDTYFWRHGSTVQFDQELKDIRLVHPGFFDIDYGDYYAAHVGQLESMVRRLESQGVEVSALTDSHMAPLRRRSMTPKVVVMPRRTVARPKLISLTPDWIDDFGHFGPFERRIHEAASSAGFDHLALASAGLKSTEDWQIPLFTEPLTSKFRPDFEAQLAQVMKEAEIGPGSIVMFYVGDVWHIPALLRVAKQNPDVTFVVNLMKSHEWIESALLQDSSWAQSLGALLRTCMRSAVDTNLHITVDTHSLAEDVNVLTGCHAKVWPMVALSPIKGTPPVAPEREGEALTVLAPVYAQHRKGFADLVELSELLERRLEDGDLKLLGRIAPQPAGVPDEITRMMDRFLTSGGQLVRGHLSDSEFASLIGSADVVLVPYRLRPFRTRTSGVVLDALLAGKPVVTVRGTWAGDLVERLGAGVTYNEGDPAEMASAIEQVSDQIGSYRDRFSAIADEVITEFAPERLIGFLKQTSELPAQAPTDHEVEDLNDRVHELRSLYQARAVQRSAHQVDLAIARDDRRRAIDDRMDRIDLLEASVAWHQNMLNRAESRRPNTLRLNGHVYLRSAKARLNEVELVAGLLDPDGLVPGHMVDVGAHHGSAMSHFVRRGWAITALEPDIRHLDHLESTYGLDERVTLDNRAVTDVTGEQKALYISEESPGVSGLSAFLDSHVIAGMVETVSLKDALDHRHVDVLKIDTEGFDLSVLQGFPWDRDSPDAIICEFEDRKTVPLGYTTRDLGDFLVEAGYQVWMSEWFPVVRYGIQHDWHRLHRYPCDPSSGDAWGNFVAFKKPRGEETIASALAASLKVENPDAKANPEPQREPRERAVPPRRDSGGKGSPVTTQTSKGTRRQAVVRSLRGSLGPAVGATLLLAALSAGLAIIDQSRLAMISGAAAVGSSVLSTLIVATRLQRRAR